MAMNRLPKGTRFARIARRQIPVGHFRL